MPRTHAGFRAASALPAPWHILHNLTASTFSPLYNLCLNKQPPTITGASSLQGGRRSFSTLPQCAGAGSGLISAAARRLSAPAFYVGGPPVPYNAAIIAKGIRPWVE